MTEPLESNFATLDRPPSSFNEGDIVTDADLLRWKMTPSWQRRDGALLTVLQDNSVLHCNPIGEGRYRWDHVGTYDRAEQRFAWFEGKRPLLDGGFTGRIAWEGRP